jgi:site-specific DNA recombinase
LPRIKVLETERDDVAAKLAQAEGAAEVVTLHPAAIEQYRADVARLADLAAEHRGLEESAALIDTVRRLVES